MLTFFQALVHANLPGLGFNGLLDMLVAPVARKTAAESNGPLLHKQVRMSGFASFLLGLLPPLLAPPSMSIVID